MNITNFENKKIASYTQVGEGLPVIFVHGFCEDSSVWDSLLTRFPSQYIVRIDLPGFGNSEQIKDYSIARFAEVVYAVFKDLNIKNGILIGHSMGGYVALEFAKNYENLLKGLCLFHSHPYEDTPVKKEGRKKNIEFIQKNGPIYYVKQLIPALFTPTYSSSNHLELAKLVFAAAKYTSQNIIASLEAMIGRSDSTEILTAAKCPILFIIGKEDTIVPDYLEDTALPNISSIHIVKGVAHMGMLEAPVKCERIIKDFIQLVDIC
ncbi:MAG: pimeloyl-ACP methyl ester carboxylesterase [Saprospiraceae bacterium]|jgi:pimeloyl-ACP methyl ester carboxylesterase